MISDVFDYERHLMEVIPKTRHAHQIRVEIIVDHHYLNFLSIKKHRTKILKDKQHKSRQKKQQSTQVLA
jgi:hypothetical protein